MAADRGGEVVVRLGAEAGIGEGPGEAHRPVDPRGVHRLDEVLGGGHRRPGRVAAAEPPVPGADGGEVAPDPVGEDVDVRVDDGDAHPSHLALA